MIVIENEQIYDEKFADVYDDIYPVRADYSDFAQQIHDLVAERRPGAATLLDVACGTGEHLVRLREHFDVTGIDLSAPMVRVAQKKLPAVPVHVADMRDFDLGRTFDAVVCMYSSVGYLPSVEGLFASVSTMVKHVAPGGVLVVEPWVFEEDWNGGDLVHATFQSGDRTVTRMGQWTTQDGHSCVEMHYLVGEPQSVRHFVNKQELSLFTRKEYFAAFDAAECTWEYLTDGFSGRGVFVATRP
ncbi:class I SAM-dependent DNA methyltransferase [Streptomyces atroolivaceus]|uniref:class I SAM-dependent DNA methyltransferase n=1 Tax=Streptomyces atroolivaceus TaxID=66869 RepID=UPI0036A17E33